MYDHHPNQAEINYCLNNPFKGNLISPATTTKKKKTPTLAKFHDGK
jgi:hypothetical protein